MLGVIYVPLSRITYMAAPGQGAFKREGDASPAPIGVSAAKPLGDLTVVASRSHGSQSLDLFLNALGVSERISTGSSLKFCLVAEGRADFYPRFGPIWEWDTAAGHAILREAGARITDARGLEEIAYNKPDLLHQGFVAIPLWLVEELRPHLAARQEG